MTRVEYIRQLEFSLSGKLTKGEISDILRDYSEYFEAGKAEGKSEEEIVRELGIPSAVAAQLLSEIEENRKTDRKDGKKERAPRDPDAPTLFGRVKAGCARAAAWCRAFFARIGAFFKSLLHRERPARPALPRPERAQRPLWQWLLGIMAAIILVPVGFFLLLGGVMALFFLICALAMLAFALLLVVAACVFTLIVGVAACAFSFGLLPPSAVAAMIALLLGVLAGGVLSACLSVWLLRGIARLTRYCMGKSKKLLSRRDSREEGCADA